MYLTAVSTIPSGDRRRAQVRLENYVYGFNGQLKDNEVYGDGNSYTAEYWQYDPRLGRRWNLDPKFQEFPWQSPYATFNNNPIKMIDPKGLKGESTDVKKNEDGSYTVVDAKNDGDNNIYVIGSDNKRTGEVIGKTLTPFDFMQTNDKTGALEFKPTKEDKANLTFRMDKIGLQGKSYKQIGIEQINFTNGENMVYNMNEWYTKNVGVLNLMSLAQLSANGGELDIKAHLGMYTPVLYKVDATGVKYITTIRAVGNIAFGFNMLATNGGDRTEMFYKFSMQFVGAYNQHKNDGNGYNKGMPFYGEHTYSGTFIYFGYFGKLPSQ